MMYSKLVERVTNMLEDSLRYSEEKLGEINALELLKKNDTGALGYFRYSLARQVGSYLGRIVNMFWKYLSTPKWWTKTLRLPCH